jgi:endonuclease YncB( thermonuclease family)
MNRAAFIASAMWIPVAAAGEIITGRVVAVGDTITVLVADRPVKVRLAEIDTPERGQSWSTRANGSCLAVVWYPST